MRSLWPGSSINGPARRSTFSDMVSFLSTASTSMSAIFAIKGRYAFDKYEKDLQSWIRR